ncbi:MAG: DNA translocase FtsK [Desulfovibrionales bacterium]
MRIFQRPVLRKSETAREAPTDGNKILREFWALAFLFLSIFLTLSLVTYSPLDPGFNQQVGAEHTIVNQGGVIGAYLSGLLVDLFGLGALLSPVFLLLGGFSLILTKFDPPWWRWVGFFLLFLCFITASQSEWASTQLSLFSIHGGGFVGGMLDDFSHRFLKSQGSTLLWVFTFLVGLQLSTGISWSVAAKRSKSRFLDLLYKYRERGSRKRKVQTRLERKEPKKPKTAASVDSESLSSSSNSSKAKTKAKPAPVMSKDQPLPPLELLSPVKESRTSFNAAVLDEMSRKVESCLADFGVQGEVQRVQPGPVVTMFEFKPAPGVKISRIAGLADDLSLAMKAIAVRIVAPLPGKDTVGIEVPNESRQTVYLREIIASDTFRDTKFKIPLTLGKDIQGQPRIADLAKMPHLLVAGATGAGKSVCLNSLVLSMLYKSGPDKLKLLMIDPKRIELAVYGSLPHLVHPVVTDMHLAKAALDWAVQEMEQRYEAMAGLGVRNIDAFNQKVEKGGVATEEGEKILPMPYLVIIIDELADLMLTAAKEVEVSIVRLAQLARAAGIHMILATQRPSVDVVTGLIKANFPSRIAFQVSSKHDSRTILDTVGAEYLLGMGDMLFKGGASKLNRIHGTYVSDDEINGVVEFWSGGELKPSFEIDFAEWKKESGNGSGGGDGNDLSTDPQYNEAVDFVLEQGKASISFIQRRFRIGFNRAARYIEQMEQDGLIGPQDGSKPRQVLRK